MIISHDFCKKNDLELNGTVLMIESAPMRRTLCVRNIDKSVMKDFQKHLDSFLWSEVCLITSNYLGLKQFNFSQMEFLAANIILW